MLDETLDVDALVDYLHSEIKKFSSAKAYAESLGISRQYLVSVLKKTKEPGLKFWRGLGYEKAARFMK